MGTGGSRFTRRNYTPVRVINTSYNTQQSKLGNLRPTKPALLLPTLSPCLPHLLKDHLTGDTPTILPKARLLGAP